MAMSRCRVPDYLPLLLLSSLSLAACQPIGKPPGGTAAQGSPNANQPQPVGTATALPISSTALSVADKAGIYALVAATDPAELSRSLDQASHEPNRGRREFWITALVERMAEIDPMQAMDAVSSVEQSFAPELLSQIFAMIARENPDRAIEALATLKSRYDVTVIHPLAMTVLAEIREDSHRLDAWLQAVPPQNRDDLLRGTYFSDLQSMGFQALADADPDLVLDRIVTMTDRELWSLGIFRVADILARHDARGALARIETAQDQRLRDYMRYQLLQNWAGSEPIAALNYLASLDSWGNVPNVAREESLRSLGRAAMSAGLDPLQLLAISRQMPPDRAGDIRDAALDALAKTDPVAASAYIDEVSAKWRFGFAIGIAAAYVELDPTAAFRWAVQQESPDLEQHVLTQIARDDVDLALQFALDDSVRSRSNALTTVIVESVRFHPESARALANRLAQSLSGSALYESALSSLASTWIERNADDAVAWLSAPGIDVPGEVYQAAALAFVRNPAAAVAMTDRIPAEARPLWVEQIAANYIQQDLEAAVSWIEQHRGDPAFALGAAAAVEGVARFDPSRAADLLAALPPTVERQRTQQAALALGSMWAQSDPRSAADWAIGLSDDAMRNQATMNVVAEWSRRDRDAAHSWILRQPADSNRDRLLQGNISMNSRGRPPDARLLEGFSSDQALTQAVLNMMVNAGNGDPTIMRGWFEEIDLPAAVRQRVETTLGQRETAMRSQNPRAGSSMLIVPPAPPDDSER